LTGALVCLLGLIAEEPADALAKAGVSKHGPQVEPILRDGALRLLRMRSNLLIIFDFLISPDSLKIYLALYPSLIYLKIYLNNPRRI
jgi:hypothetical protein